MSEDPARDGLNWYAYCGGNPIVFVDPSGYSDEDIRKSTVGKLAEILMKFGKNTNAISVFDKDEFITIYAYVNISGSAADKIIPETLNADGTGGITYREATTYGIKSMWEGEYDNKQVKVKIVDLGDGDTHIVKDDQKSINININDEYGVSYHTGWDLKENPGKIEMYTGDNRDNYMYTQDDFSRTVGHEFGHAFGVADLYNDQNINVKFPSIMNSQWQVNGAQSIDYAMMLKAQRENKWQIWGDNKGLLGIMGINYK